MMTELSPDLHHDDASLDNLSPESFRAYFRLLPLIEQVQLAQGLESRFHNYALTTIRFHDQAALGLSADYAGLSPEIRVRRQRIGEVLLNREVQLDKIRTLLGIALGEVNKSAQAPTMTEIQVVPASHGEDTEGIPLPSSSI